MSDSTLATTSETPAFVKASDRLSLALGIPAAQMIETLKAQCFRNSNPDQISNAQLAAFISIANDMGVNPLLPGMLYAYPDRGAIFPIMGPDGVYKKLSESNLIESWESIAHPEDVTVAPTHAIAKIWRKGSDKPISYTALLSEWQVMSNPNWKSRPRHMLSLRALKQCARQVIHGLPGDEDDRIIAGAVDVTPRPAAPAKEPKGAAAVKENAAKGDPAKAAAPTIEVTATPVAETPAPAAAPAKEALTTLAEGQRVTVICQIEEFVAKMLNVKGAPAPCIKARVSGEYVGEVVHLGGGVLNGDKISAPPAWQLEKPVGLELLGVKNTSAGGKIFAQVQSIEIGQAQTTMLKESPTAPKDADEF